MTTPEAESASGNELVTLSQVKIVKDWFTKQLDKKDSIIHIASNSNLDDFVTPGRYDIDKASSEYVITNSP